VAAGEQELEPLVGDGAVVVHGLLQALGGADRLPGLGGHKLPGLGGQDALAAEPVDGAVAGRRDQPGAGIVRGPLAGPALSGDSKRLLSGLLGKVEVTEEADQGGEDPTPLGAEDLLDRAGSIGQDCASTNGLTSTDPPSRRAGIRLAISSATSMLSTSNT
jgi:hypothetical protein